MTQPLTGRKIDWAKTQAEMRRPYHRRKGEKDGPFSWGTVLNAFVMIVIFLAISYVCFMVGRHYESVSRQDTVNPVVIWKEYKASRIPGGH